MEKVDDEDHCHRSMGGGRGGDDPSPCDENNDWVIKVNDKVQKMGDSQTEKEHWKKLSIYKVPSCVTDLNQKAYQPQAVSFGPYHHGKEHLKAMEEHKHRALLHFLKRSNKPLQSYFNALAQVVQDLKDSYDSLDPKWQKDTHGFLQLMIFDGCFMLEILRTATQTLDDYADNDPIFSHHGKLYIMPYIKRDMLMLENQLPMQVLGRLLATENHKATQEGHYDHEELVRKMIIKFCLPNSNTSMSSSIGKCSHLLDVYRKSLLWESPQEKKKGHVQKSGRRRSSSSSSSLGSGDEIIRSATELNEAGIRFKKSRSGSLKNISFRGRSGVLRLPMIVVDDATESMFLNLIAFERFHVGAGNEITSYIFFMDNIIDNARDVSLLHSYGIIQNAIGSDKAVAKLFNSLSKDITLDPESSLDRVHQAVNKYCKKRWNEWRANLIHTYFRNPWAVLSVIAAVFLFALTIAQTIYTIYPYYHPK